MNFYEDPFEKTKIYQPERVLKHPNYKKIEKNIHVLKNFTTEEERIFFIQIAENASKKDWEKDPRKWWNNKIMFIGEKNFENEHVKNIYKRINDLFDNQQKENFLGGLHTVHRMQPGESMFPHSDNPSGVGVDYKLIGLTNYVIFGMVLYHNDFNGGEIYYKHLGISYKPEKGDLLMHPGSIKYSHGTRPVLPGNNRYISTMFLYEGNAKSVKESGLVFESIDGKNRDSDKDPVSAYLMK
jgi:hypothetical protein